jgi:hypothetical protein
MLVSRNTFKVLIQKFDGFEKNIQTQNRLKLSKHLQTYKGL